MSRGDERVAAAARAEAALSAAGDAVTERDEEVASLRARIARMQAAIDSMI